MKTESNSPFSTESNTVYSPSRSLAFRCRFLAVLLIAVLFLVSGINPGHAGDFPGGDGYALNSNFFAEDKQDIFPPDPLAQDAQPLSQVEVEVMPPIGLSALLLEDIQRAGQGLPPRFAEPISVEISPKTHGTWEKVQGGELWRLRVISPDALSLNFGFTRYYMPGGGKLYLYDPGYNQITGPFTEANNHEHGELWTPIVEGQEAVIEVFLPHGVRDDFELHLGSVNHGYNEFGLVNSTTSGNCNRDVICPEGDDWREQIRSVGVISTGGSTFCTGFLVNNTAQDLTPYFMTARHCGITAVNASSLVVYWNFEQSYCRNIGSPDPGDGTKFQYNTGSTWLSAYTLSDFTLVVLNNDPDEEFNVYWAGWDRTSADADWAVGIHHPQTNEKRISFEYDPTTTTSYLGNTSPGDGSHIRVEDWDLGTTEPGSSGSPLFNQDKRVIGQLHGGYAACGNDLPDWYGRISVSWTGGGAPSTRLSDYLDPLNSGVPYLDGRNLIEAPFTLKVTPSLVEICAPEEAEYGIFIGQAEEDFEDPVMLAVEGYPSGTLAYFSTNPVIPEGDSLLTITDTGNADEGSYSLDITATSGEDILQVSVDLNLYAQSPLSSILQSPPMGSVDLPMKTSFTWEPGSLTGLYAFELDYSPFFFYPIVSVTELSTPEHSLSSPLEGGRCYWWRVQGNNSCGTGPWSDVYHYATVSLTNIFFDDIEDGNDQWEHAAAQGQDLWVISTAQSYSPTNAWFVPNISTVVDSSLWNKEPVELGASSTLTFWHRFGFEANYDGGVLEISTNGGATWTDLGSHITVNGYNGTLSTNFNNPIGGRQAWTGTQNEWGMVEADLNSFAGHNAHLRWRHGSDTSVSAVGWYIDDVSITAPLPAGEPPLMLSVFPEAAYSFETTSILVEGEFFMEQPVLKLGDSTMLETIMVSSTLLEAVVPAGLEEGAYDLTVYNGDCQQYVMAEAFTVMLAIAPSGEFTWSEPAKMSRPTYFNASIAGSELLEFSWDFGGDGIGEGLNTLEPVFTYEQAGFYMVTLEVWNFMDTFIVSREIEVLELNKPVGDFSWTDPPRVGEPVSFSAEFTGEGELSYAWEIEAPGFGEGFNTASPVYTFSESGTFSINLTVTGEGGSETVTKSITVLEPPLRSIFIPVLMHSLHAP